MRHVVVRLNGREERFDVPSVDAWSLVARSLIQRLRSGDILALTGSLGAGKTTFFQALAQEFGVKRPVQSPTFALMRSYSVHHPSVRRLLHVDAYRIEQERELLALDLDEELSDGKTVLVIEWPEKIPTWIHARPHIEIRISL